MRTAIRTRYLPLFPCQTPLHTCRGAHCHTHLTIYACANTAYSVPPPNVPAGGVWRDVRTPYNLRATRKHHRTLPILPPIYGLGLRTISTFTTVRLPLPAVRGSVDDVANAGIALQLAATAPFPCLLPAHTDTQLLYRFSTEYLPPLRCRSHTARTPVATS